MDAEAEQQLAALRASIAAAEQELSDAPDLDEKVAELEARVARLERLLEPQP